MWVRHTLAFSFSGGSDTLSYFNQSTIRIDSRNYLKYTVFVSLFVAVLFSKCDPATWEICFLWALAGSLSETVKNENPLVPRCQIEVSFSEIFSGNETFELQTVF